MSEDEVREWSDWLDEAAEEPEWLGSAHLAGGPPREVDKRSHGESQLHGAEPRISPCWVRVRSLHRFFDAMVQSNARDRPGVTPDRAYLTPQPLRRSAPESDGFTPSHPGTFASRTFAA